MTDLEYSHMNESGQHIFITESGSILPNKFACWPTYLDEPEG